MYKPRKLLVRCAYLGSLLSIDTGTSGSLILYTYRYVWAERKKERKIRLGDRWCIYQKSHKNIKKAACISDVDKYVFKKYVFM